MNRFITWLAAVLAVVVAPQTCLASSDYPSKKISIVVPFAAGGAADLLARLVADKMTASMGQVVVVENRPGGGGSIGSAEVARAAPDGYTLLLGTSSTHGINPWVFKLPYEVRRDFTPVTTLGFTDYALTINPKTHPGVSSVSELLRLSSANKPLAYATMGNGTTSHLASALLSKKTNTPLTHVPYKAQSQAQTDLLGGRVDFFIDNLSSVIPQAKAGSLKILATTGPNRSAAALGAPTVAEQGVPGYEIVGWFALFVPAGTPEPVVAKLNAEVSKAMQNADVRARLATVDIRPVLMSPAESGTFITSQLANFRALVEMAGAKAE